MASQVDLYKLLAIYLTAIHDDGNLTIIIKQIIDYDIKRFGISQISISVVQYLMQLFVAISGWLYQILLILWRYPYLDGHDSTWSLCNNMNY